MRLEEGNYPPVYYLPRKDVKMERLIRTSHTTHCPHKGDATYYSLCNGRTARNAVWSYEQPLEQVKAIKDHLAFYPGQSRRDRLQSEADRDLGSDQDATPPACRR